MILFFYPYIMLCYSAGYALLQTLDGMGVISTNFVGMNAQGALLSSYWSPNKVAVVLGGCFLELMDTCQKKGTHHLFCSSYNPWPVIVLSPSSCYPVVAIDL